MTDWCGFKMLVGEEEDKKKYHYERDRYGAQERKRAALEVEIERKCYTIIGLI